jgi:hypothetical protein
MKKIIKHYPMTDRLIVRRGYMTYQFNGNPNTIPVSKIICTCTTIFLKFYNKCVVPYIDSRVKIIDNERPGAGPCDLFLVIVRVL